MREIIVSILTFFAKVKYRKIERLTRGLSRKDREAILSISEFEINYELGKKIHKVNKIALWYNNFCGYSCGISAFLCLVGEDTDGSLSILGFGLALILMAVTYYIFKVRVPRLENKIRRAES